MLSLVVCALLAADPMESLDLADFLTASLEAKSAEIDRLYRRRKELNQEQPDNWRRSVKTITAEIKRLEKPATPFWAEISPPFKVGQIGKLNDHVVHVKSIVNAKTVVAEARWQDLKYVGLGSTRPTTQGVPRAADILVVGLPTKDLVDGSELKLNGIFEVSTNTKAKVKLDFGAALTTLSPIDDEVVNSAWAEFVKQDRASKKRKP